MTFNAFIEKKREKINLGKLGEFELGEINVSREARLNELHKHFGQISGEESSTLLDAAETVGEMLEVLCINGDGIKDFIVDMTDVEKHGEDAIGAHFLKRLFEFIRDYTSGEAQAGEE